jgi:hypothetical protein
MLKFSEAFPDFEQIGCGVSSRNPQLNSGILCSILLSYVDTHLAFRREAENRKPISAKRNENGLYGGDKCFKRFLSSAAERSDR